MGSPNRPPPPPRHHAAQTCVRGLHMPAFGPTGINRGLMSQLHGRGALFQWNEAEFTLWR